MIEEIYKPSQSHRRIKTSQLELMARMFAAPWDIDDDDTGLMEGA